MSDSRGILGWDEVRRPSPVFAGDTICSKSDVFAARPPKPRRNAGVPSAPRHRILNPIERRYQLSQPGQLPPVNGSNGPLFPDRGGGKNGMIAGAPRLGSAVARLVALASSAWGVATDPHCPVSTRCCTASTPATSSDGWKLQWSWRCTNAWRSSWLRPANATVLR